MSWKARWIGWVNCAEDGGTANAQRPAWGRVRPRCSRLVESIALGQSQFDPVGGTIDATVEAARIDKGLQQQQRMTKACPPITDDSAFGQ